MRPPRPAVFMPELSIELTETWLLLLNLFSFYLSFCAFSYPSPFYISQGYSHESFILPIWTGHLRESTQLVDTERCPRQQIARWTFGTRLFTAQLQMMTPCPRSFDCPLATKLLPVVTRERDEGDFSGQCNNSGVWAWTMYTRIMELVGYY